MRHGSDPNRPSSGAGLLNMHSVVYAYTNVNEEVAGMNLCGRRDLKTGQVATSWTYTVSVATHLFLRTVDINRRAWACLACIACSEVLEMGGFTLGKTLAVFSHSKSEPAGTCL